jgi:hypothetical protein
MLIYFRKNFLGKGWLVTIHSSDLDLMGNVHRLFEEKNKKVVGVSIDALYYNIISEIVDTYTTSDSD